MAHQDYIKGGGTVSAADEQRQARAKADAERRRAYQDRVQQETRAFKDKENQHYAKLFTRNLGGLSDHAVVVLRAENRDGSVLDYIICNLVVEGDNELALVMVCPRCLHRHGRSLSESHITLHSSSRRFTLHEKHRGELWVNPKNPSEAYHLAGSVDTHEVQTCPMCAFRFEIGPAALGPDDPVVSGAVKAV